MALTADDVNQIARLARLSLSENEAESFAGSLNGILDYVQKIDEVDTGGVEPTLRVARLSNVVREDRVEPSLSTEEALSNAPDKSGEYFRVPRVLEINE